MDFEGDEIEPITAIRGGRHIGQIVAASMRPMPRQEAEDASLRSVCAEPRKSISRNHGGNGTSVYYNPPLE